MARKTKEVPLSPMTNLINLQLKEADKTGPLPLSVHPPVLTAEPTQAQLEKQETMNRRADSFRVNLD